MEHILAAVKSFSNVEFLTGALAVALLIFSRFLLIRAVDKIQFQKIERKKRWMNVTRSLTLLLLCFVFIFTWGKELQSLAISLAAVAVALVLALKEMILCLMGGIFKATHRLFEIGDRITINGIRGEIVDHTLYMTTLFEVGPGPTSNQYTGRQVKIPNSSFLTSSFFITPSDSHYILNVMVIAATLNKNLFEKQEILLKAAKAVAAPYMQNAQENIESTCKKQGVKVPDLKPRVLYETTSASTLEFHVRMPMPHSALTRTENKVKDMFLHEVFKRGLD